MQKLRQWLLKISAYRIAVLIGLAFTAVHVVKGGRIDQVPVIGALENILHDLKFKERGIIKPSGDVVIAAVDEKAIGTIGRWQFPRGKVATLVDKISALNPKAIVFDVSYKDKVDTNQVLSDLRSEYAKVALTNKEVADSLAQLESAKATANGQVSASLEASLKVLEKYRALQASYDTRLATASEGKSGDQLLADAVHKSGRVVLGSILLTPNELRGVTPEEGTKAIKAIRHARIAAPTLDPSHEEGDELIKEEPVGNVWFHTYAGAQSPFEELLEARNGGPRTALSFFNTIPDSDGIIRREPLVLAVGDPTSEGEKQLLVPNIDLAGILKYYDADPGQTRLWTASETGGQLEYVAILPGSAKGVSNPVKKSAFKRIPVDQQGQLLLNYYGPDNTFPVISLADFWTDQVKREQVEGKVVLFAATATGTYDQRITPFSPLSPGVEIHATAMENILHDQYLLRPWWADMVEALILLAIALLVGRLLASIPVVAGFPVMLVTAGGYHLFDFTLFKSGISVFSAYPILEVLSIYTLQTIYRYNTENQEKRQIRRAFQFYLNKSVIEEMLKDPTKLKLGGDKKVLSVMFSDIRGFTTISEKLSPEGLAKLINEYLTPMTNLVFETGGTLDKYIGDALMAIWGAPLEQEDHAYRACKTAVAMMSELGKLQERWKAEGRNYPPIDIGIGINSGPMVVGNMGADQRFDYTVLGDNVNLASRLEGTNKDYRSHIIISQNTYAMCKDRIAALELGAVRVKGKKEPVGIYELLDDKPATGEMAEVIALFNEAVALFKKQQWEACREKCRAVLARWPHYGPPHAYIEFCNEYEAHPPPADWDGVYTMTHK